MKSFFKFIAELVWFLIISLPLAIGLLIFIELVSLIKSIIIKCQKITTR